MTLLRYIKIIQSFLTKMAEMSNIFHIFVESCWMFWEGSNRVFDFTLSLRFFQALISGLTLLVDSEKSLIFVV